MRDRLRALQAAAQKTEDFASDDDEHTVQIDQSFMDVFQKEVNDIRNSIEGIKRNIDNVKKKHSSILSAPVVDDRVNSELDNLMGVIKKDANNVRAKLKAMEQKIHDDRENAQTRIKVGQHAALSRDFADVMSNYNTIQVSYREKCKERIQRQLDITGQSKSSEEVEDMLEKKNIALFTSGIIIETQQARQALGDIEARHQDIVNLEKSIRELHEMFLDMAMLVESQGEMINRIEHNVDNAADYISSAKNETKKAVKYQSKARRKKIIVAILCVLLLIIIGVIIYVSV
ncbi:syntaxin-like [Xenia sp. Carnegie-2017]|uniref:syntaxin-like n=1 Tax=Xenia sp. Carnegie-2017 TaxID=2897299 RepID=UPI001F03F3DD|nr:syntaxin-like [Xenia sp. Carnegie-2017]